MAHIVEPDVFRDVPPRYAADGRAIVSMSRAQKIARERFRAQVSSGQYEITSRPCPLCSGTGFTLVAEKDRYGIAVRTGICRACGLPQTLDLLRPEDYADFYTHIYRRMYADGRLGGPAALYVQQLARGRGFLRLLQSRSPAFKKGSVLEVGCAAGGNLAAFAAAGHDVTGYDFDERFLRYGRNKGLDLRFGSMGDIPPDTKFDLIILSHVLEHLYDLDESLGQISRLLRPGGWFLIEVPGIFAISHDRYGFDFLRYLQSAHLYHFDSSSLKMLLAKHGFACRYSDEMVRGLFQFSADTESMAAKSAKHDEVLEFLKHIEAERKRHRTGLFFHRQMQEARATISVLLRMLGLKDVIDRFRRRPAQP